jgi:hypothetical protein
LKITPWPAVRSTPLGIGPTGCASYFAQAALAKEFEESAAPLGAFIWPGLTRRNVGEIDIDDVGNWNCLYAPFAARRFIFARDVFRERSFSLSTLARAEASALLASAVSDDPDGWIASVAGWSKPQIRASGVTRHRSNILLTSLTDVQCLPPTSEIASRPFFPSARNAATVKPN